jgi:hypothetical protein
MTGTGGTRGGFTWSEDENFAELARVGEAWEVSYGFEATARRGRQVVARQSTPDYEEAVRQLWQVIGYYFAAPEHAERIRRDLLARAGLEAGDSRYLPVPDASFLTGAGGGAGGREEAVAENERRARILSGEPAPAPPPAQEAEPEKRPWWKRFGRG